MHNMECLFQFLKRLKAQYQTHCIHFIVLQILGMSLYQERMTPFIEMVDNTIKTQLIKFPQELCQIIIGYFTHDFEQKGICFEKHRSSDKDLDKLVNVPISLLDLSVCKKEISCIIELWDGHLASGSFYGEICIWDPWVGKCLKKINTLEGQFIKQKESKPQKMEMCQISDSLIAVTHHNTHHGATNNIYVIDISTNQIEKVTKYGDVMIVNGREHQRKYSNWMLNTTKTNSFISITQRTMRKWEIEQVEGKLKINFIFKKAYDQEIKYVIMSPCKKTMIIVGQIYNHGKTVDTLSLIDAQIDTQTQTNERIYIKCQDEYVFLCPYIIENYLIVCTTDKMTYCQRIYMLFDSKTLKFIKSLDELDNKKIENIIHLSGSTDCVAILEKDEMNDYILIMDLKSGTCVQNIKTDKLRTMTKSQNGFVTVSVLSEMLFYDLI